MSGFGVQTLEVPEIVVGGLGLRNFNIWFRLRGVDQIREFDGVLNEENWNVVSHDIPITLLGAELYGKAPDVTHCIGATSRPKHRRESKEGRCGSKKVSQNPGTGHVFGALVEFGGPECTGTPGMDYSFGDTLMVKTVYLEAGQWLPE